MGTRTSARTAGRSSSRPFTSPRLTPPPTQPALRLTSARTGDHVHIHQLLVSVFHGPSTAEFQAQLDEPGYEASDRLVVRDAQDIVAHLRLARQTISLSGQNLPVVRFMDLVTAPEYRGRGLASAMVAAGERAAAERGILVGLTRTKAPRLFAKAGWSLCGRHVFSIAAPRAILAELSRSSPDSENHQTVFATQGSVPQPLLVRPMRRIDLPAIVRLYEQAGATRLGWPVRSQDYWEWLLSRGACDQVYVAATAPEQTDLAQLLDSIVGYAFVRQFRLVEMITAPGRDGAATALLERMCADASERDGWRVRCDLPPEHPGHKLVTQSGGEFINAREQGGEVLMAKVFDPLAMLRHVAPLLFQRARTADFPRPAELGIELRAADAKGKIGLVERFRLHVSKRSVQVTTGGPSRHVIALRASDFGPLVLGDVGANQLEVAGKLKANGRRAREIASAIFPAGNWWRPPLDELLV